jgi:4-hydroxy-3-methylbut-2-en-1-yl diphosphate synthase IspG/GcpE
LRGLAASPGSPHSPNANGPPQRGVRDADAVSVASECERAAAIQRNIKLAHARKKTFKAQQVACPGCAQHELSPPALFRHAQSCCPDLMRPLEV